MNKMKDMKMLKMISTSTQAVANILKFEDELERSPELQARLAYARAWYANRDADGEWHFAPSKFVGYEDIDAKTYLHAAEESDGRRTEAQLQQFFKVVDPTDTLHDELNSALVAFLAKFAKTPSTKTRINVRKRGLAALTTKASTKAPVDDSNDRVVEAIVTLARTLPTQHFQQLRERLEDIWS